jgi:hypothetical protein
VANLLFQTYDGNNAKNSSSILSPPKSSFEKIGSGGNCNAQEVRNGNNAQAQQTARR